MLTRRPRFSKDSVNTQSKPKTSVQRGVVTKLIEQFPALEVYLEDILPKGGFSFAKWYVALPLFVMGPFPEEQLHTHTVFLYCS